jgi:gamma-glutamylaminecyclotransferase
VVSAEPQCWLFVYGSLKRGQSNHAELDGARFVAEVRTAPGFALRVTAGYPLLVPGARPIVGELFELPTARLALLDAFEGAAYVRREIELEDGRRAVAYLASEPNWGTPYAADEWPELIAAG